MKCPHCLTAFHDNPVEIALGQDGDFCWGIVRQHCPSCKKFIFTMRIGRQYGDFPGGKRIVNGKDIGLAYPKASVRPAPPPDVPTKFANDYKEAGLVLVDSPKASAALSRRCLQNILREEAKVKHGNLADEIQQVIDSGKLPSYIAESIDAVRNSGNFAAHPIKSTASGEIVDVEPNEAEWNLDVLDALFDFYFVQPALLKKKRDALNAKLKAAGKPEMKTAPSKPAGKS